MPEPIIEDVGGEFGATVRYQVHENNCSVEFFAAEILGRTEDGNAIYWGKDANSFPSDKDAYKVDDAERYVAGFVKWDGCSHVDFGDENGQLHMCGRGDFNKLAAILAEIYERCGTLMKAAGTNLLEGEFAA